MKEEGRVEDRLDGVSNGFSDEVGIDGSDGKVGLEEEEDGSRFVDERSGDPVDEHGLDGEGEGREDPLEDEIGLGLGDEGPWERER